MNLDLQAPSNWSVTATSPTSYPAVTSGQTVQATFQVVPQSSRLFETDPLTGTAGYTWSGGTALDLSVTALVSTSPPVQPPYRTFSSATDAPAAFGQSGQELGISGAGADVYSGHDNYSAIYLPGAVGSNTTIQTEVVSQQSMTGFAKAGIMVRNSIAGAGTTPEGVILFESPSGGFQLEWDSNGGSYINSVTPLNGTIHEILPAWLRLVRSGSTYTGYYSTDGTTWNPVGSGTVPGQAATQDAGMFMVSHVAGSPGQVLFNGFSAVQAQTIAFTSSPPAPALYGGTYAPAAAASSGLPVTFGIDGGSAGCSLSGGMVSFTGVGTCVIDANQAMTYGDPLPALTYQVSGFVNQDTLATSGVTGSASCVTTATASSPAGTYPITCTAGTLAATNYSFPPANFVAGVLTISRHPASIGYTGGLFFSTGGATATTAGMTLQATIVPAPGGTVDLTSAGVTFLLYRSSNVSMAAPDATCAAPAVSSSGVASCTLSSLGVDNWTVIATVPVANGYFSAPGADPVVVTVYAPTTDTFVTGGGWVTDPGPTVSATNQHGNFGFVVRTDRTGAVKGQSVYVFRGSDGYDYIVKGNSWQGGGLAVGSGTAGFGGKSSIIVIDPATGLPVSTLGGGNYTYRVDVTENDTSRDTYAISVYTPAGTLWHQAGTTASQLPLGGGAIVIHSR